jgi:hypothetical protein
MTDTASDKQKHLCGSSCITSSDFKTKNGPTTSGLSDGKNGALLQHPSKSSKKDGGGADHQAKL